MKKKRHLTLDEQSMLGRALRRSHKLIAPPALPAVERDPARRPMAHVVKDRRSSLADDDAGNEVRGGYAQQHADDYRIQWEHMLLWLR